MPDGRTLRAKLIEYDGRLYELAPLIRHLSPQEVQEMWDELVRRWPALTAEIVTGARPVG